MKTEKKRAVLAVACPKCDAHIGQACESTDGTIRLSFHRERHAESKRGGGKKKPAKPTKATPQEEVVRVLALGLAVDARLRAEEVVLGLQPSLARLESHIEGQLLGAMIAVPPGYGAIQVREEFVGSPQGSLAGEVWVVPQADIGGYRVDFGVYAGDRMGGWVLVVVECDGVEFHSARDRLQNDRQRDRSLLTGGVVTVRFTGPEIWKDALACARVVGEVARARIDERLRLRDAGVEAAQ